MQIKHPAVAGTLESSDVQVTVRPNPGKGLDIRIESIVMAQFGEAIMDTVSEILETHNIKEASVHIIDKGALDWVIRSRLQAAFCRSADCSYDWKGGTF